MPNIITTPRFWENRALLAKAEVTPGTEVVPDGAANWIEARNLSITPMDTETADRNLILPYMGHSGKTVVAQWVKVTFETLAAGSGAAGTAPKIDPLLLACGLAKTVNAGVSVVYNLISTAFGAASIYINIDGVNHKMIGARGTVGLTLNAKAIPVFRWEFDAAFVAPAAVVMPAITRTGWPVDEPVNAVNTTPVTINAVAMAFSALDLLGANQRARLSLPGPQAGVEIVDRAPSGSATVLAPPLATIDPFALATAGTNVALSVTHGSAAGKKIKADGKIVISNVAYDQIETMAAYKIDYDLVPVSGNDELAFTFM